MTDAVDVFPICPDGGKPSASSHVPTLIRNPTELSTLSVEVGACARLRPQVLPQEEGEADVRPYTLTTAAFTATRANPVAKGKLCQDLVLYRPAFSQLELARLDVFATSPTTTSPSKGDHRRRVSNLTEMMRLRPSGDLGVESKLKARWLLPLGQGAGERTVPLAPLPKTPPVGTAPSKSLCHAEIRTCSGSPRILPTSIYLSRQVNFFAAVPTDEYTPLSVLDKEARTRRLSFRPEVELHSGTPDSHSLDEGLGSALHSVIESRPSATPLPHLPNGSPRSSLWNTIPIRHVASSVGEGVGRVRREYARASRRVSGTLGSSCDSPLPVDGAEDVPPPMTTDGSLEDDWDDGWEAEYARAVEDDGGPDDLVLGLLDEEEEERRKQQKQQKKKQAM